MFKITCQIRLHKGLQRLFIESPKEAILNKQFRQLPGILWSRTYMQWHLPFSRQHYEQLCRVMEGIATISNNFPAELFEPKKYPSQLPETEKHVMLRMAARAEPSSVKVAAGRIETVNAHVLPALQQTLVLKAYSRSTIKVYTNEIAQFLYAAKNHPVDDFSIDWRFR